MRYSNNGLPTNARFYTINKNLVGEWDVALVKWRYYRLSTIGRNTRELTANASISELDKNNNEISCFPLDEASNDVQNQVSLLIAKELAKRPRTYAY